MRGGRQSQCDEEEGREGSGAHLILSAAGVIGRQPRRNRVSGLVFPRSLVFSAFVSGYGVVTMSLYSSRAGD